jgi:hypothetical protein
MFKKIIWASPFFMLVFPFNAKATCPPIVPCKVTAEASTIAGSNADQKLITFSQSITSDTTEVAQALMDMANAQAKAMGDNAQSVIATNAQLSQIELNQTLTTKRAFSDREMAHAQQMTEAAYRSAASVVSSDDTEEEFQLILDTLGDNLELSVPEVIFMLTEQMDKNKEGGKVLVQLAASKGVCSEEDVQEEGKCSIAKRVFPGKKLSALFQQCSANKRMLAEMKFKNEARAAAAGISNTATNKALERTNSAGSIIARVQNQMSLSCSPSEFKAGKCKQDISPEEYQEEMIIGNIIPGGDVSASNFSSPMSSSAPGYIEDLSENTKKEIVQQSLDREALVEDPNQRAIPLVHTYRNANQVAASLAFIDNIVSDDLVPALSPQDRRKVSSAEYQSRHLTRMAALSMVRLTLTSSLTDRAGEKMRKMLQEGSFDGEYSFEIKADLPDNKESVLGASVLDVLQDRVNKQSASLQMSDQNGASANAGNDFVSMPSSTKTLEIIVDGVMLQNEMMMKDYFMNEQIIALQAISLAQKSNSAEMVKLMENLRRGR